MGPAPAPSPSPDVDVDVEVMRTRVRTHLVEIKRNTEEANLHRAQIGEILWIVSNAPGAVQRLGYETVGDWMKREFDLDRRMAEQLRRNYEVFFANRSLSPELQARVQRCDWTKLREIAPHVTDSNVEELVKMAETLSRNALIAHLRPEPAAIGKNDDVDGAQPNGLSTSMVAATKNLDEEPPGERHRFGEEVHLEDREQAPGAAHRRRPSNWADRPRRECAQAPEAEPRDATDGRARRAVRRPLGKPKVLAGRGACPGCRCVVRLLITPPYVAVTRVSTVATCPRSCVFFAGGCFAREGTTQGTSQTLDVRAVGMTALEIAKEEAARIEAFVARHGGRVPDDGLGKPRTLRLHELGDAGSEEAARVLAHVIETTWLAKGGGPCWTYAHTFASIPRAAWGRFTLSGFDRLVFRGSLLPLMRDRGMHVLLARAGVRLLDFRDFVAATTERVKGAMLAEAERGGRPVEYLDSPKIKKEERAERLLRDRPLRKPGLICIFKALEPCRTFEYHRSADPRERGLRLVSGKCMHIYKYALDPHFGFMSARLQTWFPFNIQVCFNGREWLARQLARRASPFHRADNCFTWVGNPALAQRLMDEQLATDWPSTLTRIARWLNPLHDEIFAPWPMDYYWSGYQTEWATDVVFDSPESLAAIYPALVRHATEHFKSPDVLRFLGRKLHGNFTGEVTTSLKHRPEGVRVKHWVRGNSVKMYDKAGSILRVETTVARTNDFKVLRPHHTKPEGKLYWQPLRKGVADLHRRAEVSQRSNERYLDALAVVDEPTPCSRVFDTVARPVFEGDKRFRALRIGDPADLALLGAVTRGEFATAGFRNRDIRQQLHPDSSGTSPDEQRRASAKVSRQLRLLRAHGLIKKIPKTHRYQLTDRGRLLTAALHATRAASVMQLLREAA
jgi:hypothetical protein